MLINVIIIIIIIVYEYMNVCTYVWVYMCISLNTDGGAVSSLILGLQTQ